MLHETVRKAIYEKYVPRVVDNKPDPDVLWVGPLIDGLVWVLGNAPIYAATDLDEQSRRRRLKGWLMDSTKRTLDPDPFKPQAAVSHDAVMVYFQRNQGKRLGVRLVLSQRTTDGEPGALINSYTLIEDPETGIVVPMWGKKLKDGTWPDLQEPIIREDKRFNLHYLKRGDRLTFDFKSRKGEPVTLEFSLRHPTEGSSFITPERRTDLIVW